MSVRAVLPLIALLALGALSARAGGAELAFELPVASGAEQRLVVGSLADADELEIAYRRDQPSRVLGRSSAALEVVLITTDGRYFSLAEPFEADDGEGDGDLLLDAAHWGASSGMLGTDALASVCALIVRVHADEEHGRIAGTIAIHPRRIDRPRGLILGDGGLVDRGPWRELSVRLIGERPIEEGEVELVDGARQVPLFLDQPGRICDGEFAAVGPARWVARLRPDEHAQGTIRWRRAGRSWSSRPLPPLEVVRTEPLAALVPHALPVPSSPSWIGSVWEVRMGTGALLPRAPLKACPAPILSWNRAWTSFRGPGLVSWTEAAACDCVLAHHLEEVDLCPQCLLEDQGTFRLGLSPWSATQGGPWRSERDAWTVAEPWNQWAAHMRAVLARARAAPGLQRWRLGVTGVATGSQELERLHGFLQAASTLVATYDGRPLEILHPQAVEYGYDDAQVRAAQGGSWFSFEDSHQGWQEGPLPLFSATAYRDTAASSDGQASLAIPLALPLDGGRTRAGGAYVATDSNLFNLDQLRFDAQAVGGGDCQLYLWVTDENYHWFQQRLAHVPADGRWRTVAADFCDDAAWEGMPATARWSASVRRRIRRLGVIAFSHQAAQAGAGADAQPLVRIDHVCRYGWPSMAPPTPTITLINAPADRVPLWEPIAADFAISVESRNPYDPEQADVVGEVEGEDGSRLAWPAYWAEPVRLDFHDGVETAVPEGAGAWHWRFTPPHAGTWRWRLHGKIRWRDRVVEATSPWQSATTDAERPDAMPPIRVCKSDPQWFETLDGKPYYPLGITLRSPGDTRQVPLTAQIPAPGTLGDRNDIDRPLDIRTQDDEAQWERMGTRAYERWFARMRENGMNWARVWMTPWWCGLEWRRDWTGYGGLTWYNQANAACLDRVMELARRNHVYLQIDIMNHGQASERVDQEWDDSPYNAANGGMCDSATEFFASDAAFASTAKRYRYTLARWGWQSLVAAWVLCSELEWTDAWWNEAGNDGDDGRSGSCEKWVRASLDWFKAHEAWERPVSLHFSNPWKGRTIWPTPGLGFNNSNCYTGFQQFAWGPPRLRPDNLHQRDLPIALEQYLTRYLPPWQYHRPTIISEWGGDSGKNDAPVLAQELHTGLWLQAVLPYGGDVGFWWWLWVDGARRWDEYGRLRGFLQDDDRRHQQWRIIKPRVRGAGGRVLALGMASLTQIRLYAFLDHLDQRPGLAGIADAGYALVDGVGADSVWRCERWSPSSGRRESADTLTANAYGELRVPLASIDPDAAFRLSRDVPR